MSNSLLSSLIILGVIAIRVCATDIWKRQPPSNLSRSEIEEYAYFTHFASAAYCQPKTIQSWSCGGDCAANADFIPYAIGGDGLEVQFWYVGFSPSLDSVIVAHQGTDYNHLQPLITDVDIVLKSLDSKLFPGVPPSVQVHSGFADDHSKSAARILSAVLETISRHQPTKVTIVGHSLGGALALLDGVFLPLHISGVAFRTITYGLSRVGNHAFADYVDTNVRLVHINNKEDPVPLLPPRILGYQHASGEIHINDDGEWISCPGQDNTNFQCTAGGLRIDLDDHFGPYNGVMMGDACSSES